MTDTTKGAALPADADVADALKQVGTAIRFACSGIKPTEDEALAFRMATVTLTSAFNAHPPAAAPAGQVQPPVAWQEAVTTALEALNRAVSVYDVELADRARSGLRRLLYAAPGAAAPIQPAPEAAMFDAFGNPRTRHVRITHDGVSLIERPENVTAMVEQDRISDYTLTDVYLSERELDDLPEFDGF
jgi:hypothetical protein